MIQVFKFLSGSNALTSCNFLHVSDNSQVTRGHSLKLVKEFSRTDIRRFSFSQRVVHEWNSLPEWVVIALILFSVSRSTLTSFLLTQVAFNS